VAVRKNKVFCKASFPCQFKRFKRNTSRKHRYFLICKFDGACSQQSYTPVVKDREEVSL